MKRVVLVVGHSFKQQGAINLELGITEYDYCMNLALELFKYEEDEEIDLILKARNKSYENLINEINTLNADLVIELHLNAYNKIVQGTEVLYAKSSSRSKEIAQIFQNELVKNLGLNNRGIKGVEKNANGAHLLYGTISPCIIVEPFFLDATNYLYEREVYEAIKTSIKIASNLL